MTNAIAVVKEMQITELYGKLMWGCTTLLLVMFSVLKIPYGGLVLAAMLGMIILLYAAQHHMKISICFTYYHAYMALLACFIAASSVWAIEPAYAVRRVKPLVETLIVMKTAPIRFSRRSCGEAILFSCISLYAMVTVRS